MSVECDDAECFVSDFKKLAGHDLVAVICRSGKQCLVDDVPQCKLGNLNRVFSVDFRKLCKVLTVSSLNCKTGLSAPDRNGFVFCINPYISVRELSYNICENVGGYGDDAVLCNFTGHSRFNTKFCIISRQFDFFGRCINENAFQNRHRCFGRYCLGNGHDRADQIVFCDNKLHSVIFLSRGRAVKVKLRFVVFILNSCGNVDNLLNYSNFPPFKQ